MNELLSFAILAISSLVIITNPLLVTPVFLATTEGDDSETKRKVIRKTVVVSFLVLLVFAISGTLIFRLFSITLGAFQIAGGIILFTVAFNMLKGKPISIKSTPEEMNALEKSEVGIVPLAIPMVSGPGAITTVLVLSGDATSVPKMFVLFLAIAISIFVIFISMNRAAKLERFIGKSTINTINRLMGLILAAVSVQFVIDGIKRIAPVIIKAVTMN